MDDTGDIFYCTYNRQEKFQKRLKTYKQEEKIICDPEKNKKVKQLMDDSKIGKVFINNKTS